MADVYVNALTQITSEPTSTDSLVLVNRNTNEGKIIDYNKLADVILAKLASKQFSSLTTASKLLPGAINELDADTASMASSISQLNSRFINMPDKVGGRLVYINADTDPDTLTKEWTLTRLTKAPDNITDTFWYVHTIAYNVNSDGTVAIGKQIAYGYSGNRSGDVYVRTCYQNSWTDWFIVSANYAGVTSYTTTMGTAFTFNISTGYRGVIFFVDSTANRCGAYIVYTYSSGSVGIVPILSGSGLTIDSSVANKLTVTSAGNVRAIIINGNGTCTPN